MSLIRSPAKKQTVEGLANKHEDWEFHINGSTIAEFFALTAPSHLNGRLRNGIDAKICGSPCRVRARSSFRSRRRSIDFSFPDGENLRFRRRGLHISLEDRNGTVQAQRSAARQWEIECISEKSTCVISFIEMSGAITLLSNPLLRNL